MPSNLAARSVAQNQPATNKIAPIVTEFKQRCVAIFAQDTCIWPVSHAFLNNAKVLQKVEMGCSCLQSLLANIGEQCKLWNLDVVVDLSPDLLVFPCSVSAKLCGIFWTEIEFVEQAVKAKHPLALESAVPGQLLDTIKFAADNDDATVARVRAQFFATWTRRALQLEKDEKVLKTQMCADVARAVVNKRILVFREMLQSTQYPDMDVVDELQFGSDLTGDIPVTGMLPGKFEPSLISEDELKLNAMRVRKASISEVRSSGDAELDETVWEKTMKEVENGWLIGLLDESQVPAGSPLSRRFGLRQRLGKVRLIDDYSESGVNSCVTVSESPMLHTVDIACAALMFWFGVCKGTKRDSSLAVRTFDLASAYRRGFEQEGTAVWLPSGLQSEDKKGLFFQKFGFAFWSSSKRPLIFETCQGSLVAGRCWRSNCLDLLLR